MSSFLRFVGSIAIKWSLVDSPLSKMNYRGRSGNHRFFHSHSETMTSCLWPNMKNESNLLVFSSFESTDVLNPYDQTAGLANQIVDPDLRFRRHCFEERFSLRGTWVEGQENRTTHVGQDLQDILW